MSTAEYQREWRLKRIKEGFCISCGQPNPDGHQYCASCNYKNSLRTKACYHKRHGYYLEAIKMRQRAYLEKGCCKYCGAPFLDEEKILCISCRIQGNENKLRRR